MDDPYRTVEGYVQGGEFLPNGVLIQLRVDSENWRDSDLNLGDGVRLRKAGAPAGEERCTVPEHLIEGRLANLGGLLRGKVAGALQSYSEGQYGKVADFFQALEDIVGEYDEARSEEIG